MDFMCDALMCGRRFRTFNIVDDFNREVLAIEIDLSLPAQGVIRVLERVVAWRGFPAKLRIDNGPEFISSTLADWAEKHQVVLEFIKPGKPTQNSFIERFNRTYRTEILDMYAFKNLQEVRELTEIWIKEYNDERPHDSLNDLTPWEYLAKNKAMNSNLGCHYIWVVQVTNLAFLNMNLPHSPSCLHFVATINLRQFGETYQN
ncbi:Integrase core domain [Legionella pneumophila]|nr:Integrase core domain [Legionella pneumophila]CZG54378.1 Integrase core domain [Legionella pneumophila]CZG59984.1 Integrase core domain [Legionella pneumophila]CZG71495.1 Integrase core domain [Legionella pneumophila]CZG82499.1 Integrase core domain [Legionella pneumophila]